MPIYEYRCGDCKRRVSVFFRSFADTNASPRCPNCNGEHLTRLVSRVATVKSEDARLEAMSDPSAFGDVDENDPKSVARFMRRRFGAGIWRDGGPARSRRKPGGNRKDNARSRRRRRGRHGWNGRNGRNGRFVVGDWMLDIRSWRQNSKLQLPISNCQFPISEFLKPFDVEHKHGRAANLDFDRLREIQFARFHHRRHRVDELGARVAILFDKH